MDKAMIESWQVGDVKITRISEVLITMQPEWLLANTDTENVKTYPWLKPLYANDNGELLMSVHSFVLELNGKRIMIDTGIGNDKPRGSDFFNMLSNPFLEDMTEAGFAPESIDTVVCTHMHVDHVGWNTRMVDGQWVPTFPNAKYVFARIEHDHWQKQPNEGENANVFDDSVKPIIEAGLAELVATDHQLCDEIRFEPSPGHTPGHFSVHIASNGEEALLTGDMLYSPLQVADPDIVSNFCSDAAQEAETRRAFFRRYADTPVLIIGAHMATPTGGYLKSEGDGWIFEAQQ